MEEARERSWCGDRDKWNGRELISSGEDLAGDETERALLLSRRRKWDPQTPRADVQEPLHCAIQREKDKRLLFNCMHSLLEGLLYPY
jgi:hypothetical protein